MTTCLLCGQPDHPGKPCYAELRLEWKRLEVEKRLREVENLDFEDAYAEFCEAIREREMMQEGL